VHKAKLKFYQNYTDEEAFFTGFDLCLSNVESWRNVVKEETTWLAHCITILILKA